RLAMLEVETGAAGAAVELASALGPLALRLGPGGSEEAFAAAVLALARLAADEPGAAGEVDTAVARLDQIDARYLMPEVLNVSAQIEHARGDHPGLARKHSRRSPWRFRWTGRWKPGGRTPHERAATSCVPARAPGCTTRSGYWPGNRYEQRGEQDGRRHRRGEVRSADRPVAGQPRSRQGLPLPARLRRALAELLHRPLRMRLRGA